VTKYPYPLVIHTNDVLRVLYDYIFVCVRVCVYVCTYVSGVGGVVCVHVFIYTTRNTKLTFKYNVDQIVTLLESA